jgi:ABC-type branched-subunit amino acid transport system ATPase component
MAEQVDHREERQLDTATLLEHPHLTSREQRLLEIVTQMAIEERLIHTDE